MLITLDPNLAKVVRRRENTAATVLDQFMNGSMEYDFKTRERIISKEVFHHSIPENADLYHTNYLSYLQATYNGHDPIVLDPHVFWYQMMTELAQAVVADPKRHADIFTRKPDEKINIVVDCGSETDPLRMDAIAEELVQHVPVDISLFLPKLTSETEMARLAILASFLEAASPYYNYMMLACGHPTVKLGGETGDWELMMEHLLALREKFSGIDSPISMYLNKVYLTCIYLKGIMKQEVSGEEAVKFFMDIFSERRCGSGSQTFVSGWWATKMFMKMPQQPEVCNFPSGITKVPYTTLPSGTEWELCFGLTHSFISQKHQGLRPDFSSVQVKKLKEPRRESLDQGRTSMKIEKFTVKAKQEQIND